MATVAEPSGPLVPVSLARGRGGAVVAPHHLAAQAGLWVLRSGGNAVDAAIATNAALAVVAAHSCGLGGDAFWLIWPGDGGPWPDPAPPAGGGLIALNGSGRAPAAATIERYRARGHRRVPFRGPLTITVPGAVRSWRDAHARFGSLPVAKLLQPAIDLAEAFPASAGWSAAVERATSVFGSGGDWARVFRPAGRPWRPGQAVHLPALARTLRRLASDGLEDFYEGALAAGQTAYLERSGSLLAAEDLAAHDSTWGDPIFGTYRGTQAASHPPNSAGVLALETLQVLDRCAPPDPAALREGRGPDARWVHLGLQVSKLALADREREVTDPEAMEEGAVARLLGKEHTAELAARLDPAAAGTAAPTALPRGGGTVCVAVADRWGGAVSLLQSNYAGFGSGLVDPGTGVAYQNRGALFSLDPAHRNALAARKRTLHTLAPGMLFRGGRPWVLHGSMGGDLQPQIFAQVVSALVDGGIDVAEAVAAPRWGLQPPRHFAPATQVLMEARFPAVVIDAVRAAGHPVTVAGPFDQALGHCHAIELVRDGSGALTGFAAATDPRSEGLPALF